MKAVFFDRDGVLNDLVCHDGNLTSPWSAEEFRFKPGAKVAVDTVKSLGFMALVVTNQPGIDDGDMTQNDLNNINHMLIKWLGVDDILCATKKDSSFYKPNNGMIERFIEMYDIDRTKSFMIGDRWKDIVPGHNSKLTTIFCGDAYNPPTEYKSIDPNYKVNSVIEASTLIVELQK